MEWPEAIEYEAWSVLTPVQARELQVLPIERTDEGITIVAGKRLAADRRSELKATLEFFVGRPVKLLTRRDFPNVDGLQFRMQFRDALDRYFVIDDETLISESVSRDAMLVLLLNENQERYERVKTLLVGDTGDSLHGIRIIQAKTLEEAVEIARDKASTLGRVLIAIDGHPNLEEAIASVSDVTNAKIHIVFDNGRQKEFCPAGYPLIDLSEDESLVEAIAG